MTRSRKKNLEIEGLSNIHPPIGDQKEKGQLLTEAEVKSISQVRFFERLLDIENYTKELLQLQALLQWAANVGRNKNEIGLEDCRIAIIDTREDASNTGIVDSGAAIVVVSKDTGKAGVYDVLGPNTDATFQHNYARTTAFAIIDLAK